MNSIIIISTPTQTAEVQMNLGADQKYNEFVMETLRAAFQEIWDVAKVDVQLQSQNVNLWPLLV